MGSEHYASSTDAGGRAEGLLLLADREYLAERGITSRVRQLRR
jgi:hypothetical protein